MANGVVDQMFESVRLAAVDFERFLLQRLERCDQHRLVIRRRTRRQCRYDPRRREGIEMFDELTRSNNHQFVPQLAVVFEPAVHDGQHAEPLDCVDRARL